ncbi:winged helix DNA-binding domain-containing protein [Dactylosporangium salmoneum]|uniref:Winged helix DNA-binding domain-containing protein n=1 Tax=Dactylosporangium salmoneum TaxID=53361 RepID=A0ABN3H7M9_9ACTN
MDLSPRRLNRATLARQMLLERAPIGAAEGVRRAVALQAQQPASPYLALWNRLAAFDPAELDAAYADRSVVRATLMRIAMHTVTAEDYPAFHHALRRTLRGPRLGDPRFTASGLSAADADALVPRLLEYAASPQAGAELQRRLGEWAGVEHPGVWWAIRTFAPLWHAPAGPPWSFGTKPNFVAAPHAGSIDDTAVPHLIRRYLTGFGPATPGDIAQFGLLPRSVVREALAAMEGELQRPGAGLVDVAGAPLPDEDVPAPPRLLPMWDSVLLAYEDRGRVLPPQHRALVTRRNGDVLPTVLVDGYVAGVWRATERGIEVTAFEPLPAAAWDGLEAEAAALTTFLAGREPLVYARYGHWWDKLPPAETRVL